MKEFIGNCSICRKELYCFDGFLNGIILEHNQLLICFDCEKKEKVEKAE